MKRTYVLGLACALAATVGCSDGSNRRAPEIDNPPSLSGLADTEVSANSDELRLGFTVSDDQTDAAALSVAVSSDSADLFAGPGPAVEGSGGNREVVVTPAPGTTGSATLTVTVTDAAGQSASADVRITVVAEQVDFGTALRSVFAADENDPPLSLNDKEFQDNGASFDDLIRN